MEIFVSSIKFFLMILFAYRWCNFDENMELQQMVYYGINTILLGIIAFN